VLCCKMYVVEAGGGGGLMTGHNLTGWWRPREEREIDTCRFVAIAFVALSEYLVDILPKG
jgi:hypothetical protein